MQHVNGTYHEELVQRSHISATTTKKIIRDCICQSLRTKLLEDLREAPDSLLMGASGSIFGKKYLAVFVRYVDLKELSIVTRLLKVIELTTDQTGETLLGLLNDEIFENDIAIRRNLICISTDNGSNMVSNRNFEVNPKGQGVVNRLKKESNNLIFVRDMCHCFNLVADEALDGLPKFISQFITKLCSYMNHGNRNYYSRNYRETMT